ncbi:MAG: hypothetical protein R2771_13735 [Saprospiraceae bacterium]
MEMEVMIKKFGGPNPLGAKPKDVIEINVIVITKKTDHPHKKTEKISKKNN